MKRQHIETISDRIKDQFLLLKKEQPERLARRLNLSWSNWGFGMESLQESALRLQRAGIRYIELHGNHYGPDLGYDIEKTLDILSAHEIAVSGVCGMFSPDNDLSSNRAWQRQAALSYIERELAFTSAVGGTYLLVVPGAVGRPVPYDAMEFERSVETLRMVADQFVTSGIRAAIEPIRSDEVSFCHTIQDAKTFINAINHLGIKYINGDVYHMQSQERHIGEAILEAGDALINLHVADSNRGALGEASLDLDTIIMALYVIGFNVENRYVTPEPLGPGGNPYRAMYGRPDPAVLNRLVMQTAEYFREREEAVLSI
ncbi:TIM barrel protein [Paenibacillus sp. LMG 31461]|uniref:TIM barrel protein n=1 Tax=Paenibacillus plantarum TaxID=2654975 RepID=A0ABX1XKB4_9BACL|nr:sugar phosphate isomerase/epimerase family protein [Paenibacillus plantarum]NOU68876.1 TIM barrel protein [Paenibacillus plantarum]